MLKIKRLMTKYVPGMLTCQEVDSFLYDFHEGYLSFSQQLKFKVHILMCRECRAYVKDYKNTIRLSKEGVVVVQPEDKIPQDLMLAILKTRNEQNSNLNPSKSTNKESKD